MFNFFSTWKNMVLHFAIVDYCEFFVFWMKSFSRYLICKYFLPILDFSFYFLELYSKSLYILFKSFLSFFTKIFCFLILCVCVCVCVWERERERDQLCLTLCIPVDCSLPDSSVHGIFQARIPESVAISSSRASLQPRNGTRLSCISGVGRWILDHWATWEVFKPLKNFLT